MKKLSSLLSLLLMICYCGNSTPLGKTFESYEYQVSNNCRLNSPATLVQIMRMNLYAFYPDSTTFIVDGTATQYDDSFSNNIDGFDARKLANPGENVSLRRGTTDLVIERRQTIGLTDTIFFRMWGLQKKTYEMRFVASNLNHPGLTGFLEDSYLQVLTPINLNDTTKINFSVNNDAASSVMNRFRVIFKKVTPVASPFAFIAVNAYQQTNHVVVEWKTQNENDMKQYEVERSSDKLHFLKINEIKANNLSFNQYDWTDANPSDGNNYYRLRVIDLDGKSHFSDVMKTYFGDGVQRTYVFPNPVTGNNLNLYLVNQKAGIYEVRLMNMFGQTFLTKTISHDGGSKVVENLKMDQNIPGGMYRLEIKNPSGSRQVISVVF